MSKAQNVFLAYASYITLAAQQNNMTEEDVWTPGEDVPEADKTEGEHDDEVGMERRNRRIEATRSPRRARASGQKVVVRKGSLEAEETEEE
jgi:hypothetical protein